MPLTQTDAVAALLKPCGIWKVAQNGKQLPTSHACWLQAAKKWNFDWTLDDQDTSTDFMTTQSFGGMTGEDVSDLLTCTPKHPHTRLVGGRRFLPRAREGKAMGPTKSGWLLPSPASSFYTADSHF